MPVRGGPALRGVWSGDGIPAAYVRDLRQQMIVSAVCLHPERYRPHVAEGQPLRPRVSAAVRSHTPGRATADLFGLGDALRYSGSNAGQRVTQAEFPPEQGDTQATLNADRYSV
jgi:hypothetical protein